MNIISSYPLIQLTLTAITSFLICFLAIPSIIKVAELKHLFDNPDERKKHGSQVPTLGGIAIFAGFIFSTTFWSNQTQIIELQYIIAALIVMFFMGIKDDIINLVAHKKLLGQLVAASIIVYFADIRLTSLYGIFDIYNIPYWPSIFFSIFTVIALTNSINLIDGIDTLAGSIGFIISTTLGVWFYLSGNIQYAILSFSLIGCLLAFLHYNKTPARIFMGDTGSLVLGLVTSILAIKFIELNRVFYGEAYLRITSVPAVTISIFIIPIFDTIRVFILRIMLGKSPLSADRNHMHHILTDLGYSHIKSTLILVSVNITLIILTFSFKKYQGEGLVLINFALMFLFTSYLSKKRRDNRKNIIPIKAKAASNDA